MLDLFHIAKPQGCDIQTFYGNYGGGVNQYQYRQSWNKPRGVSHVYILMIGQGGNGDGTTGGGSSAVTVWYGAAQHVPDMLSVEVGTNNPSGGHNSGVYFVGSSNTALLSADGPGGSVGGTVMTANFFTASGFFSSTAGQNGSTTSVGASTTTFLSGGGATNITPNYGYPVATVAAAPGYFQMQPIIVGRGGRTTGKGGIGCGGGASSNAPGGDGMILIASW